MEIRKDHYNEYVKQVTPVYPLWRNMLRAFLTGGVICTIGKDHETAATLVQMGAEHHECEVSDIIEDSQRKLVTTPAYMLAQSIAEAASGINKLVDRVLELAHH